MEAPAPSRIYSELKLRGYQPQGRGWSVWMLEARLPPLLHGGGIPRSLLILRARLSLISE